MKLNELNKIVVVSSYIFSTLNESCDQLHKLKDESIKSSIIKGQFELIENEMKGNSIVNKLVKLMNLRKFLLLNYSFTIS